MSSRPISVTIISILFIVAGAVGIFYHFDELKNINVQVAGVFVVRLLAIVGGVFSFRGENWARWLILAWMGFHVAISSLHTNLELVIHIGFFAIAVFALFNKNASAYFVKKN